MTLARASIDQNPLCIDPHDNIRLDALGKLVRMIRMLLLRTPPIHCVVIGPHDNVRLGQLGKVVRMICIFRYSSTVHRV